MLGIGMTWRCRGATVGTPGHRVADRPDQRTTEPDPRPQQTVISRCIFWKAFDVAEPDEATVTVAKLIASTFIERRDVKAQQFQGGYSPVREHYTHERHDDHSNCTLVPWGLRDVIAHVQGERTYGHYVVSQNDTCRMFAFDIDLKKTGHWLDIESESWKPCDPRDVWLADETPAKRDIRGQLIYTAAALSGRTRGLLDIKTMIAYSGSKGLHVYGILDPGTPAGDARDAALMVLQSFAGDFIVSRGANFWDREGYPAVEVEVYPKQDTVRGDGFGNLLRLPLGINRKTGQRGFFVKMFADRLSDDPFVEDDPILAMTHGSSRIGVSL